MADLTFPLKHGAGRRGTPVVIRNAYGGEPWACVVYARDGRLKIMWDDGGWGDWLTPEEADERGASQLLSDPTGFAHLLWWVAERLGADEEDSETATFYQWLQASTCYPDGEPDECGHDLWGIATEDGHVFTFAADDEAQGEHDDVVLVPALKGVIDRTEAILAIANHLVAGGADAD